MAGDHSALTIAGQRRRIEHEQYIETKWVWAALGTLALGLLIYVFIYWANDPAAGSRLSSGPSIPGMISPIYGERVTMPADLQLKRVPTPDDSQIKKMPMPHDVKVTPFPTLSQ